MNLMLYYISNFLKKINLGNRHQIIWFCILSVAILCKNGYAQEIILTNNGGFENANVDDSTDISDWSLIIASDSEAKFIITDQNVHSGEKALQVVIGSTGANQWNIQAVNEPIKLVPGLTHTYKVWLKASSNGSLANITIGRPDYSGELGRVGKVNIGTTWAEYSFEFQVDDNDTLARAPIHFNFNENIGDTIWIDDFSISYPRIVGEPIIFEAEAGIIGNEWITETDNDDENTYITITTDYNESTGNDSIPGNNRTVSYELNFPDTGTYDLFARIWVGPDSTENDSWFLPKNFGQSDPNIAADWTIVDNLADAGFDIPGSIVRTNGYVGSEKWKWVILNRNLSEFYQTITLDNPDSLSQIFQIGAREIGLKIDKLAFGLSNYYYTVDNLNNYEAGSLIPPVEPKEPIAKNKIKWLGNNFRSVADWDKYFTYYWNQIVPGNAGKWGSIERIKDVMNWTYLDQGYNFAKENGYPFRFHVLIWGNQQPNWINNLNQEDQLKEIDEWMGSVAERYPDIDYLEVVNESLAGHNRPNGTEGPADYIDALGGTGETGYDWIITAFEMAREHFPTIPLMINDYGIMGNPTAADSYIKIIKLLQERGLIDAIGVQAHAFSTRGSATSMRNILDKLADTGLPIQATEMDIDGLPGSSNSVSDEKQLEDIQRIFPVFWEHPSVMGVTFWGWQRGMWRDEFDAYLMRSNGEERPALQWLRAYVDTANVTYNVNNEIIEQIPIGYSLSQNYPNPFNPSTYINFTIPNNTHVRITVYDITGRVVQRLLSETKVAGNHNIYFNADELSSGVYFYEMQTDAFREVKKMSLIK